MKSALLGVAAIIMIIVIVTGCGWGRVVDRPGFTEPNFTVEEFLAYIETHETTLTASDLADIDESIIEGFILYYSLSSERTVTLLYLKRNFDNYLLKVEENHYDVLIAPYLVREVKNVASTEEEYLDFIQRFFEEIGIEAHFLNVQRNGVRVYEYLSMDNIRMQLLFNFCQTNNTRRLRLRRSQSYSYSNHYYIEVNAGGLMTFGTTFYYSRSGKYLLYLDGNYQFESTEELLNIVRIFTTLED